MWLIGVDILGLAWVMHRSHAMHVTEPIPCDGNKLTLIGIICEKLRFKISVMLRSTDSYITGFGNYLFLTACQRYLVHVCRNICLCTHAYVSLHIRYLEPRHLGDNRWSQISNDHIEGYAGSYEETNDAELHSQLPDRAK